MQAQSFRCDICGKEKGQVNHWWMMWLLPKLLPYGAAVHIQGWEDRDAPIEGRKHLCGQECTHKMLDRFLTTGSMEG
jgi:hypothetical protein